MKLNIIEDGNFFLHRSFTSFRSSEFGDLMNEIRMIKKNMKLLSDIDIINERQDELDKLQDKLNDKDAKFFESDIRIKKLVQKCLMDIFSSVKPFNNINRFIFISDGHSWRKTFDPSYKANRKVIKKKSFVDFKYLYTTFYDIIKGLLKANGVETIEIKNGEGDDLMKLLSEEFLKNGESTINITSDQDIYQICEIKDSNFIAVLNPIVKYKKIICVDGFTDLIFSNNSNSKYVVNNTPSYDHIFNSGNIIKSTKFDIKDLQKLINCGDCPILEIDTNMHVFKKMLQGDDGDNVSPCYFETTTTKTGKTRRKLITGKRLEGIVSKFNEYDIKTLFESEELRIDLAKIVLQSYNKTDDDELVLSSIADKMKSNITLMALEQFTIPQYVLDEFSEIIKLDYHTYNHTTYIKVIKDTIYDLDPVVESNNSYIFDTLNNDFLKDF